MQYRLTESLNILLVDDNLLDRRAVQRGFRSMPVAPNFTEADSCVAARLRLAEGDNIDVALVDYQLGDGTGAELLPDFAAIHVPVILVTGMGSEEVAISALRGGVSDYVVKDMAGNYIHALPMIVAGVVSRARAEREREARAEAVERQWREITEMIHICSCCKKIRENSGAWIELESYLSRRRGFALSHGFCPHCLEDAIEGIK